MNTVIDHTARSVALDVLVAVDRDDAYANILLPQRISTAGFDTRDAQLATELCHGTLRWRGLYDAIIGSLSSRPLEDIHVVVKNSLRLGAHQLLSMRIETHAAVNETVDLIKSAKMNSATGFVNAILRRISEKSRDEWIEILTSECRDEADALSIEFSHPAWVVRALKTALVADNRGSELRALLESDNAPGPLVLVDLRAHPSPIKSTEPAHFSPLGAYFSQGGNPAQVTAAARGQIRVQDEGSQLAALVLSRARPVVERERWLDMCSAPGGKSAVLAHELAGRDGSLVANEVNPGRTALVRISVAPWPEAEVTTRDGREFSEEKSKFDRVLVDAPCSGLGALRRRPESRWRKTPRDVAELTALQIQLLEAACEAVKPGGLVAYVTCSPHVAETRGIVNETLKRRRDMTEKSVVDVLDSLSVRPIDVTGNALSAQLWPHAHQTDAMFIALLEKANH